MLATITAVILTTILSSLVKVVFEPWLNKQMNKETIKPNRTFFQFVASLSMLIIAYAIFLAIVVYLVFTTSGIAYIFEKPVTYSGVIQVNFFCIFLTYVAWNLFVSIRDAVKDAQEVWKQLH